MTGFIKKLFSSKPQNSEPSVEALKPARVERGNAYYLDADAASDRNAHRTILLARQLDDPDFESSHTRSRDEDPDLETRGGADYRDAIARFYPHAADVEISDFETGFACPN